MHREDVAKLLSSDLPDPTDFPGPSDRPGLRSLDTSLRCAICGEFFDAPVTLGCGHCFCSLCIRNALASKPECPHCRKPASESHLRADPAMEEVVLAWKASRSCVLDLINKPAERISPRTYEEASSKNESPRKRRRTQSSISLQNTASSDVEWIPSPPVAIDKTPSTSTKPTAHRPSSRKTSSANAIPTSDSGEEEIPNGSKVVECPICGKRVFEAKINAHLDSNCATGAVTGTRSTAVSQWNKLLGGGASKNAKGKQKVDENAEPLPKVAYDTLKDKLLKSMLLEHELPTSGDRSTWIARHEQWVMLYNANLDKSIKLRRTKDQLLKDLKKWEEGRKTKKVDIDDVRTYEKLHKSEFDRLVEVARPKKLPVQTASADETFAKASSPPTPPRNPNLEDATIVSDSEDERL